MLEIPSVESTVTLSNISAPGLPCSPFSYTIPCLTPFYVFAQKLLSSCSSLSCGSTDRKNATPIAVTTETWVNVYIVTIEDGPNSSSTLSDDCYNAVQLWNFAMANSFSRDVHVYLDKILQVASPRVT